VCLRPDLRDHAIGSMVLTPGKFQLGTSVVLIIAENGRSIIQPRARRIVTLPFNPRTSSFAVDLPTLRKLRPMAIRPTGASYAQFKRPSPRQVYLR
jgi:hypothetical protein